MDENTNDSNKQPEEAMTPTSEGGATETPSTSEESTDSAADINSSGSSGSTSSTDNSSGTWQKENDTIPETETKENSETQETPAGSTVSSTETNPTPSEIPLSTTPPDTANNIPASPSIPADDPIPLASQRPAISTPSDKKKMSKVMVIVASVVIIALIAILIAVMMGNKKTPTTSNTGATSSTTASSTTKVDTWTGKGNTYAWDTAANWSLGVPVNGDSLAFQVSSIKQPSNGDTIAFQDNIPSLSISKLIINGIGVGFDITGNPITITNGIAEDITLAKGSSTPVGVQISNALTFTSTNHLSVNAAANNDLTFSGGSNATTTIGSSTVQFVAAKTSDIEISTPISGTGEISIPASTTTTGNVDFNTASPDFTGSVIVNSGATVGMGNQNTAGTGVSSTDAFGTAAITIASGGYLEINEVNSSTFTIPNDITVAGNGGKSASQVNGAFTGAVSACITSATSGCNTGATVLLTGKVTLTNNTEFGAFYGLTAPQVPPSTTVTYSIKNLVGSSHTLTAVPSSKAVIQD